MFCRLLPHRSTRGGLLLLVLLLPTLLLISLHQTTTPPAYILDHPFFRYDLDSLEPRDTSEGQRCVLPRVHPFHPSIWGYLESPKPIVCAARRADFTTVDNEGRLRFNETQLRAAGYEVGQSLHCYWSRVKRGDGAGNVDDTVSYGEEFPVPKEGLQLPSDVEIFRVTCRNFANFAIYDRLHTRIRTVRNASSTATAGKNFVNVLIFGLDSMSRLSFIRHLPLTYKYLTEDLKMTVLRGMNKVGDNTYPNLVALLTGKAAYGGDLPNSTFGFDDWPLVWRNYSRAGYATLWAEDFPDFGLFNYLETGFRKPPTLHYLRPFWLALKNSPLLKISSHMCYGSTPRHMLQVEYLRQFISAYGSKQIPYFAFSFLAELSHEYMSRVSSADVDFRGFFQWLADSGELDNTLLIVMSDHGHRFSPIRTTQVGHLEERTPFYAVRLPMTLTSRQPKILANLLLNSGRLLTPFDAYATLADLLEFVETGRALGESPPPLGVLGLSIFGQVPANRTCKDASVPAHYCMCETVVDMEKSDSRARTAASITVDYVNNLLKDTSGKCSQLILGEVTSAHLVKTMEDKENDLGVEQKVRIIVEVQPSLALLEATVILSGDSGEVWGDVSRINPYAGQSDCIQHTILRKYCYCTEGPEREVVKL